MYLDFDFHEATETAVLLRSLRDGANELVVINTENNLKIGHVDYRYLPLGPRISPEGRRIAFFSNNGLLFVHDIDAGESKILFESQFLQAGFCEWSSCGTQICFSAYKVNNHQHTPPNIYKISVDNQKVLQLTSNDKTVDRFPQWSPCGKYIAFQRQFLHEPQLPSHIFIVDTESMKSRSIPRTDGENNRIGRYCWSPDSEHLLVKAESQAGTFLNVYHVATMKRIWSFNNFTTVGGAFARRPEHLFVIGDKEMVKITFPQGKIINKASLTDLTPVQETLSGPSISLSLFSDTLYFLNQESSLYRLDWQGKCKCLNRLATDNSFPMFEQQAYVVASRDGREVPVHRYTPHHAKKMGLLYIIGGPGSRFDDTDDPIMLHLLEEGYEVVVPGYRGCSGYGDEHLEANRGEYGRADVWDILAAGEEWKQRNGNCRPLAIVGYSYGGFLVLLAMATSQSVLNSGISLWGVTSLEHLGMHMARALPDNPDQAMRAKRDRSPVEQARFISAPLLLLHGGKDTTSTTEEVLTIQRSIESEDGTCELVIYEDDTHGLGKNRKEVFREIKIFLEKMDS